MARVCLKRERLPSCLLIENDSAITNTAVPRPSRAASFPIKASDHPGITQPTRFHSIPFCFHRPASLVAAPHTSFVKPVRLLIKVTVLPSLPS